MQEKVKIILNKILYDKLNLKKIEDKIVLSGVKGKNIERKDNDNLVSKFFFLMNNIYLENLTVEELQKLKLYMKKLDYSNLKIDKELYDFLNERLQKLLLPTTNQTYLFYGGNDFEHMAPSDSIVFSFQYIKYDNDDENLIFQKEKIINENLNYIQEKVGPENNIKVAIIKFDETKNIKARII